MMRKALLLPAVLAGALLALVVRFVPWISFVRQPDRCATHDEVNDYIAKQARRLRIPGVALAIVEGDKIVHQSGFGRARPGGEAPSPHTPFIIGSLTKSFTALAILQLVEAGQVDLDAPVQRYLPWFRVADPQASNQISVRHLLNQTSGLPAWPGELALADFDSSPGATEHQARALSAVALKHAPGTAFEYSNVNYNLLGLVIEASSGETYAHYIQAHIFDRLAMSHSYTSRVSAQQNNPAIGHRYWFGLPFATPDIPLPGGSLPAGLLISCSEDMARYLIALLNDGRIGDEQLLSPAGIEELHRGAASFSAMGRELGQYGMGWFVDKLGGTKLVWHGGTLPDFAAYMALLPEQKKGVVMLFNADHHWMNPVLAEFGTGVAGLLAGETHRPVPFVRLIPWMLRSLPLIPLLQMVGVAFTLRSLGRWRTLPQSQPRGWRKWGLHVLLPLSANLLVAFSLAPAFGKRRNYIRLYMPDFYWLELLSGGFALIWGIVRTVLMLRILGRPRRTDPQMEPATRSS